MAFNFPASPSNGDIYTDNGLQFKYDSTLSVWTSHGSAGASPVFLVTKPTYPEQGQIFYNETTGATEIYNEATAAWESTSAQPMMSWSVSASGTDHYIFSGPGFNGTETDPTLTVTRGQTYLITNTTGAHPFQIQSVAGIGGTAYGVGVTNNATTSGPLIWEVPMDAPATLYYQCTSHANMGGTINVQESDTTDYMGMVGSGWPIARPDGSVLQVGDTYIDTGVLPKNAESFLYTGSGWLSSSSCILEGSGAPTLTVRNSGSVLVENDFYIDETNAELYRWDSSAWQKLGGGGGGGTDYMGMTSEGGPSVRPDGSALLVGDHFVDNEVSAKNVENYWWTGTDWASSSNVTLEGTGAPTQTNRFTGMSLVENDLYIDETNAELYRWDSSAWQKLGGGSGGGVNTDTNSSTWAGVGSYASNTSGVTNTAYGSESLFTNTSGTENLAVGALALYSNTSGNRNVALGPDALKNNTNGYSNMAMGRQSLYTNDDGWGNVAIGETALHGNTSGYKNIAIGTSSLNKNTGGSDNVAVGSYALFLNTNGYFNVAYGTQSLQNNTTGNENMAVGYKALHLNSTGSSNTAVGYQALFNTSTGSGNIGIGFRTNFGSYSPVFDPTGEDNRLILGHTSITNAYVQVAWTVTSDARDKMNFAPVPHGLDFVNQLEPTAYQFKVDRDTETPNGDVRYGFKAQDILALEGDNPVIIDVEDEDHLKYKGEHLVPVLVNAVQELTAMVKELQSEVATLKGE